MKYIRTKDGIYKITDCQGEFLLKGDYGNVKWIQTDNETSVAIKDIIAQSENLEELCDEIVVEYKDCTEKRTYLYNGTFEDLRKTHRYYYTYKFSPFFKYYGAIWVYGKGLIYVAKMNDDGKLVLL